MLEARCMPSVSLTVRYLSSPGTVTTTMGMMTEIREILYRTNKIPFTVFIRQQFARFPPDAASRSSTTRSLPLFSRSQSTMALRQSTS